jgi:ppGpp synthetase/RelA/SpoT-type nucleotidyltranferase
MAKEGLVAVPATVEVVQAFVDKNRRKFETSLAQLKEQIEQMRTTDRRLRCVYKVYSRGEKQVGEEMKTSRKIRLKFNEFNEKSKQSEASLFDVPDIVGLTIVVPNPSDINLVAKALDEAIGRGDLAPVALAGAAKGTMIETKHGRPFETGGYFACHYNVRLSAFSPATPICEIQIKTLLHDAWGAKTHDLTYKPSGRIGAELLLSFELLGSNLANLDQQSDALRQGIMRNSTVREAKRRKIQTCVIEMTAKNRVKAVTERSLLATLTTQFDLIFDMTDETEDGVAKPVERKLGQLFPKDPAAVSALLCLLAARLQRRPYTEKALESLAAREQDMTCDLEALHIRFQGALTSFAAGDVADAIDVAEQCLAAIKKLKGQRGIDKKRFESIMLSITSDLAYYHADMIGSHEGDKRNSDRRAKAYLKECIALYPVAMIPAKGLASLEVDIINALANSTTPLRLFFALDNEAYVLIQTASSEAELRDAVSKLDFLHRNVPANGHDASKLAHDYHEYCGRQRLADLEAAGLS